MLLDYKQILEFWKKEGLRHIKPAVGGEFPEGWNVSDYLKDKVKDNDVIEVGCGYGRLCSSFSATQYTGIDVNPAAIAKAKEVNKKHNFQLYEYPNEMPKSSDKIVYTVLLHVDDDNILNMAKVIADSSSRVIIGEVMGRSWRRDGNPPVFNREPEEYIKIFEEAGMKFDNQEDLPYQRYQNTNVTFLTFTKE